MRFAVEAWDPSYGASVESELSESAAEVVLDVEQPVQTWHPIDPDPSVRPPAAVLVELAPVAADELHRAKGRATTHLAHSRKQKGRNVSSDDLLLCRFCQSFCEDFFQPLG